MDTIVSHAILMDSEKEIEALKKSLREKKVAPPRFELGTRDPESLMLGRYTTGLFVWYGNVGGMQQTQ